MVSGSILAVPLAVVIAILIEYLVAPAVRHQTKADVPAEPPIILEPTSLQSTNGASSS